MTTRCNISMMRMRDVHVCALRKTEAEPFLTQQTLKINQETRLQPTQDHLLSDQLSASHTIKPHKKFIESK